MLAGPKRAIFRPKSSRPGHTGPSRTVGAAYTGATPFRQCCRVVQLRFFETAQLARIIQYSRCFTCEDEGASPGRLRPTLDNVIAEPSLCGFGPRTGSGNGGY